MHPDDEAGRPAEPPQPRLATRASGLKWLTILLAVVLLGVPLLKRFFPPGEGGSAERARPPPSEPARPRGGMQQ